MTERFAAPEFARRITCPAAARALNEKPKKPVCKRALLLAASALVLSGTLSLSSTAAAQADAAVDAPRHTIVHPGDNPSAVGSDTMFTGKVRQDPVVKADENSHYSVTYVTFEPGARTFWHTHPAGQRLLVVIGKGMVGMKDGRADVIRAGDFVWCPPNVLHFHAAMPDTAMTHIALTNVKDGKSVTWDNPLSHDEYRAIAEAALDPLKE